MAELFGPTTLSGGATAATGFTQSGAGHSRDFSSQLEVSAKLGERVHGTVVVNQAFEDVEKLQNDFLRDRSQIVQSDTDQELARLREANPTEATVLDKTEKRVKELESMMKVGGISASRAVAQRDALLKEAMVKAPIFAQEIRGFSGTRGAAFDTETEQLIKERNDQRDGMVEVGLNPDSLVHIEQFNRFQQLQFNNELRAEEDSRDRLNGKDIISNKLLETVMPLEQRVINMFDSANGDVSRIPQDVKDATINDLLKLRADLPNVIRRAIVNNGYNLSSFTADDLKEMESIHSVNIDQRVAQLDGTMAATSSNNSLVVAGNREVLGLAQKAPGVWNALSLAKFFDPQSVLGQAVSAEAQSGVLNYMKILNKPNFTADMLTTQFKQQSGQENVEFSDGTAATLKALRQSWDTTQANPDPETLFTHGQTLINLAETLATSPKGFTGKLVEELMNSANSPGFQKHFQSLPDDVAAIYASNLRDGLGAFASQRLIPDIKSDLDKGVIGRTFSSLLSASDYTSVDLTSDGSITFKFTGNSKLNEREAIKARDNVLRLNTKYRNLTNRMVLTSANVSGKGTSDAIRFEQGVLLFRDLFPEGKFNTD